MIQIELAGVVLFVITTVFSAGVFFEKLRRLSNGLAELNRKVDMIYLDVVELKQRVAKLETLLEKHLENHKEGLV